MSIKFNGTTISNTDVIKLGSTTLTKVIFNGTTVYTKQRTETGTQFISHKCGDESEVETEGKVSVTFSKAFSSIPNVTYTTTNYKGYITLKITDVTKTGFKIAWEQTTGNSKYIEKVYIHWTAVGSP